MIEIIAAITPMVTSGGGDVRKLTVFAGHDACPMMPVLVGLGVWDGEWPEYASSLTLETVSLPAEQPSKQRDFFVRALYNKEPTRIAGCSRTGDGLCPLDRFLKLAKAAVPNDVVAACKAKPGGEIPDVSLEACKEVILDGVEGWGSHRHVKTRWHGGPKHKNI